MSSSTSSSKASMPSIDECLFGPDGVCPPTTPPTSNNNNSLNTPPRKSSTSSSVPPAPPRPSKTPPKEPKDHVINVQQLRRVVSQGIVDKGSHRAVAWRVLLGYLPTDTSEWKEFLQKERALYRTLVRELFVETRDADGSDLRGHHSKRLDEMEKQVQAKESLEKLTPEPTTQRKVTSPPQTEKGNDVPSPDKEVRRRNSIGYAPTFRDEPPLPRRKSLGDLPTDDSPLGDTVSELADRTRELYITNDRVLDRSERTRNFLKTIGMDLSMMTGGSESSLVSHKDAAAKDCSSSEDGSDCTPQHSNTSPVKDMTVPVHSPQQQDGYTELVPARIKEQWKKSGRDQNALSGMTGSIKGMNTLLVVDNEGYSPSRDDRVSVNDDPLKRSSSDSKDGGQSKWHQFYENASLLDEIRKDVVRTHPDLFFFLEPKHNLGQRRYAAIERILFVWAKLNKGVRYVQGMNEIVGTIYYVLANDFNEEWACHAEADAYFLFNTLMVEMRDVFVPDLDEADTGIQGRISNVVSLLSQHDPEVSAHLNDCGIDASFYAIRWLTTLLSREFLLPDTIRLWDSMFASTHKDNFLRYVCVTMVMIVRKDLLKGDFSKCLRLLQSYPPTNVDDLLESSRALWIFESQVTLVCHKGGISLQKALSSIAPPPAIIMAYGLPGGVTFKRSDRKQEKDSTSKTPTKTPAKKGSGNLSAGFMSQAKGYLGDIQRRYRKSKSGV